MKCSYRRYWWGRNQRGRRNLSKQAWLDLGFKRAELLKPKAEANKGKRTDLSPELDKGDFEPVDTIKEAADYAGVSRDTAAKATGTHCRQIADTHR